MHFMRGHTLSKRPVLIVLFGTQAWLIFDAIWTSWSLPSFGQTVNTALACLMVNLVVVIGLRSRVQPNSQ
jgi:hypothetical protein